MMNDRNDRFKELRRLLQLSQAELAESINVKQGTVSDIERNRIGVSQKTLNKLVEKHSLNEIWFHTGKGNVFIGKNDNLQGVNTGNIQGNDVLNPNFQGRNFKPYDFYKGLTIKDLDFELSLEIEDFRESFEDYRKLVEFVHHTFPASYLSEKFTLGPPFKTYKEELEAEFKQDHKHLKDENDLKILKIVDLYQSMTDHWRHQLSTLIDYLNKSTKFHNKKPGLRPIK